MSKIYCDIPFSYLEVNSSGDAFLCSDCLCNYYSVGNILENDIKTILDGEKAKEFIDQFKNQKFSYCDFNQCQNQRYIDDDEFEKRITIRQKLWGTIELLRLTYDGNCNLRCIFCEHKNVEDVTYKENEKARKIQEEIKKILPELNKNHGHISMNYGGEFLHSKLLIELISYVVENYPNIKFEFITNGLLCTENMLKKLKLTDRIHLMEVSVHAYKEKTYNKIMVGSNFKVIRKNLDYISSLHKSGLIPDFHMNFVVNALNYRELEDFTQYAFELGASANILPLRKLPNNTDVFDDLNISDKNHPLHRDFVKVSNRFLKKYEQYSYGSVCEDVSFSEMTKRFLIPPEGFEIKQNVFRKFLNKFIKDY